MPEVAIGKLKTVVKIGGASVSLAVVILIFMGGALLGRMGKIDDGVSSIKTSVAVIQAEQKAVLQRLEDHIYGDK